MKKVGIITLSASDNCGSLLQAYALQEYIIEELSYDVELINLVTKESNEIYSIFTKNFYKHPRKTFFSICHLISIISQRKDYELFRRSYLKLTPKIFKNVDQLSFLKDEFDCLISGSDQVWNINMSDFNEAFFLPWNTSAKKIAYAASLGSLKKIPLEKKEQIYRWLSDFEYISTREREGKEALSSLFDKEISVCADPTLILDKSKWDKLAGEKIINEHYIFYYSWSYSDEKMNKIVQDFAQKKGLKVYVINSSKWYRFRPKHFNFTLYSETGPVVFLNLMKYADFVFVQSFHGIVFANIFHKRYFFLNENQGDNPDLRSYNFICMLNHETQIITDYEDIDSALQSPLSFSSYKLDNLISYSKNFLKNSLKDSIYEL